MIPLRHNIDVPEFEGQNLYMSGLAGRATGVAAAIGASRLGAKTVRIERNAYFGGQATNSMVAAFCGFFTRGDKPDQAVKGVGQDVIDRLIEKGVEYNPSPSKASGNTNVKFDPEILKIVYDELLTENNVNTLLHANLVDVKTSQGRIQTLICSDDEGLFEIQANNYVDASGNANLAHLAIISTEWGDDEGLVQQSSLVFKLSGLPKRDIGMKELNEAISTWKEAGIPNLFKEKGMIIKPKEETVGYCTIPSIILKNLSSQEKTTAELLLR